MLARDENEFEPQKKILIPSLRGSFQNFTSGNSPHPLPLLLLCGRLPNRDELFCSVCYLFLGANRSYQTPTYAASEHLHPDLYKLPPFVAVAGTPTTSTESPAAEDLSDPWGIPVVVGEKRMIWTSFVLYKTTSWLFFQTTYRL